jgi:cobyrinic acid a,c-diamide synthase
VAENPGLAMTERHLGLMPCAEVDDATQRVATIASIVAAQVDLDRVRAVAASAGPLQPARCATPSVASAVPRVRIGIAHDRAFGFYYPDDLVALVQSGAELVPIDTLRDTGLPALDGLFIGGGFPEACMDALEANASMRRALRAAIADGLPTYAECGGLMYLTRSISWKGRQARMVGVIPGDAVMQARPVGRGYVHLESTGALPWAGAAGLTLRGHEFHHAAIENLAETGIAWAYRVHRGHGVDGRHDGIAIHNLLASFSHLRHAGGSHAWARRFVDFVRARRRPSGQVATALALAA